MKKALFIIAAVALLASCTKSVEVTDKEQADKVCELTLSTITNVTKSITEGTKMPTDNMIKILPNFHSDITSADYSSSNEVDMFGYDSDMEVWRNLDSEDPADISFPFPPSPSGLSFPEISYNFMPLYWPAGDRVFMDYVACSYNYLLPILATGIGLETEPMRVETFKDNANRMSVRYEYNVPENMFFDSAFPTKLDVFSDVMPLIKQLGYNTGIDDSVLAEYDGIFMDRFVSIMDKIRYEELDPDDLGTEQTDTLNRGYWLYMNYYPVFHKFVQDDLLYAHDRNLQNNNRGSVKAIFNHAKSWIKVIVNNQTRNDLYVSEIRFDNVQSSGTLVIDNSKSDFETYWNFSQTSRTIGAEIVPYAVIPLDGSSTPTPSDPTEEEAEVPGLIPDLYLAPAGCYGPALSIDKAWSSPDAQPTDSVDFLKFTYLKGGEPFTLDKSDCRTMVGRLSGMMFPAQEPGKISIKYKSWAHVDEGFDDGSDESHNIQMLPMHLAVETLAGLDENSTHQVTLNLPRQTWQMGKVYVYVLSISEDEITINPLVTEWKYADPIIGPEETGLRTDESTETLENGDTDSWFTED